MEPKEQLTEASERKAGTGAKRNSGRFPEASKDYFERSEKKGSPERSEEGSLLSLAEYQERKRKE